MRLSIACVLISLAALFAQPSPTRTDAAGWVIEGTLAYKSKQYERAIEAFQKSIDLEPGKWTTHVLLGNALMATFVPGVQFPDNAARAERARSEFLRALALEPNNRTVLSALGYWSLQEAGGMQDQAAKFRKLDDARDWFLKVLSADPQNRDAYYSLGVIDWTKWYPNLMDARAKAGLKPEDPGPLKSAATRRDLRMKYGPLIDDGISNLNKALEIDPEYFDAMAYMNLLIRERADIRDSPEEYRKDIEEADRWFQKAAGHLGTANLPRLTNASPPPPPARTAPPPAPQRIRVGGNVQAANLITKVDPVYPRLAVQARVQGTVHFTAIVGTDGRVVNLQLIGGHPLLVQAAQDAVKQWVYRPTLLNGTPVEVVTQIDVPFTLQYAR